MKTTHNLDHLSWLILLMRHKGKLKVLVFMTTIEQDCAEAWMRFMDNLSDAAYEGVSCTPTSRRVEMLHSKTPSDAEHRSLRLVTAKEEDSTLRLLSSTARLSLGG